MSGPRVPRPYRVFRDGVFYREFPSLKMLSEYMVENYFPHLRVDSMRKEVLKYPRGTARSYHGFTFEADPLWVSGKATKAINDDTGNIIITESVGKMARKFFGRKDIYGSIKIRRLIRSGKKYMGYRFEDISEGYVNCPPNLNRIPVPIIGTHLGTGDVILCLSMSDAAKYVMDKQDLNNRYIRTVISNIKKGVEGYMERSSEIYGYRWSFPE